MLEGKDAIMNGVLGPITFILAYLTVYACQIQISGTYLTVFRIRMTETVSR